MSLLKELIKESAAGGAAGGGATGAGNVAGGMFAGGFVKPKSKRRRKLNNSYRFDPSKIKTPKSNFHWRILGEMMDPIAAGQGEESTFDPADVLSKLKDAEKRVDAEDDTVPFGLEDDEGNLVKVYVRAEQADEFESALGSMLAGTDDEYDDDDESDAVEIAEVLFQLKDKFDIVDVEWPHIEGDEEQEEAAPPAGGEEGELDLEGGAEGGAEGEGGGELDLEGGAEGGEGEDELDLEGGEGEDEMDLEGEGDMEAEGGAESTLQQVIDMMKADAEARKAESEARAKEAEARAAEAHAGAASAKVQQEEQVLDMEAYNKQKKDEKDETDRLAKMAKWKHDQAADAESMMAQEEDEERRLDSEAGRQTDVSQISMTRLAQELLNRVQR